MRRTLLSLSASALLGACAHQSSDTSSGRSGEQAAAGAGDAEDTGALAASAREFFAAALRKAHEEADGPGCLVELARGKAVYGEDPPRHLDFEAPDSPYATLYAQCVMLSGRCEDGKAMARRALRHQGSGESPRALEDRLQGFVSTYCRGTMNDRDMVIQALFRLQEGAYVEAKTAEYCTENYHVIRNRRERVRPLDRDDKQVLGLDGSLFHMVPACYERAGDCTRAWAAYRELAVIAHPQLYQTLDREGREEKLSAGFAAAVSSCRPQSGEG